MTVMTDDELRDVVVATLARIVPEMDPATLESDVPLRDQLDLDSMDFLNCLIALHERLGVDIPEADYGRLGSIAAIVTYVAGKLSTASEAGNSQPGRRHS